MIVRNKKDGVVNRSVLPTINSNDHVDAMCDKLNHFAENIDRIQYSGMYERTIYRELGFYGYKRVRSERRSGYLYSSDDAIKLKSKINSLIDQIKEVVNNTSTQRDELESDVKRILLQTERTIITPNSKNIEKFNAIANEVHGKPRIWHQVGMVMLSIAGLICGIVPGLLYIRHISKEGGAWDKNKRQGLSLLAKDMSDNVAETGVCGRLYSGKFFQKQWKDDVNRQDQDDILRGVQGIKAST